MKVTRVLAVLNKLSDSNEVLSKSFELAKKFNAIIEVLFVYEKPLFDISELFTNNNIDKNAIKSEIKNEISKLTTEDIAIFIKINDTANRVWDLLRDDKSSLIVTKYNETTMDISEKNSSPIYIIKQNSLNINDSSASALIFESIENIESCIKSTKEFSNNLELIYNYLYLAYSDPIDPMLSGFGAVDNEILLQTQEEIFKEIKKEQNLDGEIFINGMNQELTISQYLNKKNFSLVSFCNIEEFLGDSIFEYIVNEVHCDILKL